MYPPLGWLYFAMTASNPEHERTRRVRELLDRPGLIARPKTEPLGEG